MGYMPYMNRTEVALRVMNMKPEDGVQDLGQGPAPPGRGHGWRNTNLS